MKMFFILMLFCSAAFAEEKKGSKVSWKQLNVAVENAYADLQPFWKTTADGSNVAVQGKLDASAVTEENLQEIDKALNSLVADGTFSEIKLMLDVKKMGEAASSEEFDKRFDLMILKYGTYVTQEMVFSALRVLKNKVKPSAVMDFHMRAPKEDVDHIKKALEDSGIIYTESKKNE